MLTTWQLLNQTTERITLDYNFHTFYVITAHPSVHTCKNKA